MQALVSVSCLPCSGSAFFMAARISAGKPTSAGSTIEGVALPVVSLVAAGVSVATGVTAVVAKGEAVAMSALVGVAIAPVERLSLRVSVALGVSVAVSALGVVSLTEGGALISSPLPT